ncbi:helix-turn-helix domain-containing protein [Longimicrobium sp.]|uniref:helix-turn-helix domain-containing protein n=1 Tax=Longimicrobium sp. TaxID=2029185 RepID=UPI003B3A2AE8
MTDSTRTRQQVQADLGLQEPPSDRLMSLIAQAGDGEFVEGPLPGSHARSYTPRDIEDVIVTATVGELMLRMRQEAGNSLRAAARDADVSAARIQQIERSENIEVATLVRLAAAAGYEVSITLNPVAEGKRPLSAVLAGATTE